MSTVIGFALARAVAALFGAGFSSSDADRVDNSRFTGELTRDALADAVVEVLNKPAAAGFARGLAGARFLGATMKSSSESSVSSPLARLRATVAFLI